MASKNGFPPIIGTYNGINYYMRNGKQCQRKAGGGFTSESIKNNPKMQGIRDRNKEMTLCSKFTMNFKDAMSPFFKEIHDGTLHERLMKLFMKIRTLDETPEGKRTAGRGLKSDTGRKLLKEFKFTAGPDGWNILGPVVAFDTKTGTLNAASFDPGRLKFPKGSTHFFLDYGVLEYDLKTEVFRFILNEGTLVVEKGDEARELVLEVPEKPMKGGLVFGVVKVRFYQKVGDQFYESGAKGGVGIGVVTNE
ncbi:MAG: hypothetical protein Q8O62_01580 [Aequorivita sp.]|nr:hypothetical protein [Aequorivita sp.]